MARWQGRDSRLESSSDGEIFDEENKEENVKTEEEENAEVYMSPKNEYFCTTPKNGSAQECGSKGGPHGNISA